MKREREGGRVKGREGGRKREREREREREDHLPTYNVCFRPQCICTIFATDAHVSICGAHPMYMLYTYPLHSET